MKAVIGLGNPGEDYHDTRHNVGFKVIDAFCLDHPKYRAEKGPLMTVYRHPDAAMPVLVKPLTYMNRSGLAAKALVDKGAAPSDLLVVSDEAQLRIGEIRFDPRGSSGGHNGLQSVIDDIGPEFHRIRLGIRSERDTKIADLSDYVLGHFFREDLHAVDESAEKAAQAILVWSKEGIEKAMNLFNRKISKAA